MVAKPDRLFVEVVMRFVFLALAITGLPACKSLPLGSYALMNSPAMAITKLTPQLDISEADRRAFLLDKQLIGMSISGGGMRASAFTLGVFAGLQEIKSPGSNFSALDTVDFASSNSGGSWALAALLTKRRASASFVPDNDYATYAKAFSNLNASSTKHWAEAMTAMLGESFTMGDLEGVRPRAFFNASLLPGQDAFVFAQQFADAYQIERFYARGNANPFGSGRDIARLPLGYVSATSGSVPGFTHSYAQTAFCSQSLPTPSFCGAGGKESRGWVRLVDGGLYDNIAYKSAWEVAKNASRGADVKRRLVFMVNSKDGWTIPTVSAKDAWSHDGLISSGTKLLPKGSFPLQDATFRRLGPAMFDSIGFETELLDFDTASNFSDNSPVRVDDLDQLLEKAADEIDCITDDGRVIKAGSSKRPESVGPIAWLRERGGDCLANNFARVGYHHKTSYFYDPVYFAATYQLGIFVVRSRAAEIRRKLGWSLN